MNNKIQEEILTNTAIYFPDIFDGSTMISNQSGVCSHYKDVIDSHDEDLNYKTKVFFGVNKVVELANIFNCVYLDKLEFLFIVKELYNRYPYICIDLLKNGKISFIDNDKFFMFYELRNSKSFIQIHKVPKPSNAKIIDELKPFLNKSLEDAAYFSIKQAISHEEISSEFIANKFFDDLKSGYYQALAVGINSIIGVDNENKQIFDLIAQTTMNLYICNLLKIKSIYLKEYAYYTDKYKCQFKNSIYSKKTRFEKIQIQNYTFCLALSHDKELTNCKLKLETEKSIKILECSEYADEYDCLEFSFSCNINQDYPRKDITFIKQNGENVPLSILSFEDYLRKLQSEGHALRQSKLFIKITHKKYLNSFLSGGLKFSKPLDFVEGDKKRGQRDLTEATFKCETINGKKFCTNNMYDLEFTKIWCCFSLDNYMFTNSLRDGVPIKKAIVKKEYYEGFFDENDQNAVIFIRPDAFVNRVFSSLVNKGIALEDILIHPITYIKKSEDFILSCEPPYELFYKDIAYLPQNEVRILIRNSGNKYDYLFDKDGVINIGDIKDICTVIDGMYHDDMECFLTSESTMEFTLPK